MPGSFDGVDGDDDAAASALAAPHVHFWRAVSQGSAQITHQKVKLVFFRSCILSYMFRCCLQLFQQHSSSNHGLRDCGVVHQVWSAKAAEGAVELFATPEYGPEPYFNRRSRPQSAACGAGGGRVGATSAAEVAATAAAAAATDQEELWGQVRTQPYSHLRSTVK